MSNSDFVQTGSGQALIRKGRFAQTGSGQPPQLETQTYENSRFAVLSAPRRRNVVVRGPSDVWHEEKIRANIALAYGYPDMNENPARFDFSFF